MASGDCMTQRRYVQGQDGLKLRQGPRKKQRPQAPKAAERKANYAPMTIQQLQEKNLQATTFLSHLYLEDKMIAPAQLISVLNEHGISFVLVGLHGYVAWLREPRATMDIDVIVAGRQVKKAVKVLLAAFPDLEAVDLEVVTRLKRKGTDDVLIDVMKPNQQPHREVFKHTVTIEEKGQRYRIPTLEMAMVMKFAPMVSLTRADEDKHQDAHDFIRFVKNNPDIDLDKLQQLAESIYTGAGNEIVEMVRRVRAGEKLIL